MGWEAARGGIPGRCCPPARPPARLPAYTLLQMLITLCFSIHLQFAKFSEALYIAEQKARSAVEARSKMQRELLARSALAPTPSHPRRSALPSCRSRIVGCTSEHACRC
mgnify:CR=1 FL=1